MVTSQLLLEFADIAAANQEHLICITLDMNSEMIGKHLIFKGTLNSMVVHPREIFAKALEDHAASIVISHNHPSGDPSPSYADRDNTERFYNVGRIMAIHLEDHIIVSRDRHYSFAKEGDLDRFEKNIREATPCTV